MQISAQSLSTSLATQIAASVAQAAESIGAPIQAGGTGGSATAGANPTPAPSINASAAAALSSSTLGALIQQTQTDQEPGQPPSLVSDTPLVGKNLGLQTSGPDAGWIETVYSNGEVALQPNAQAQALINAVNANSDGGQGINQLTLETDAVFATRDAATSLQSDFKTFVAAVTGSGFALTQAQFDAGENWASSNAYETQS
jgi:hypothetical protein